MTRLRLTLLGGFQARLDPGSALALSTRKSQALLAYLALPCGRGHPRDKLAALLWGGIHEHSSRASLRQALFVIRRTLDNAEGILRQERDALLLDPEAVEVDVQTFEHAISVATPESLQEAATLYHGDLLSGFAVSEEPFEEWLLGERERLRELAVECLSKLLGHQHKAGLSEGAVQSALRLLTLDPLQEQVHRTLMRLYAESGRRGAALRQYQQCVAVLNRQLGLEPESETKALYQEILRQRSSRRVTSEQASIRPEIPLSIAASRTVESDVPLIGRLVELEQIRAALARAYAGQGGVIALVGEAGIGKTRLIAELIAHAEEQGVRVLVGRCYESEQVLPFGPWANALTAIQAGELKGMPPVERADLGHLTPELVGREIEATQSSPDVLKIFASVTSAIRIIAGSRPVLVVLEDIHWADEMSLRLLAFLGRRVRSIPVLVAVSARHDELAASPMLGRVLDELRRDHQLWSHSLSALSREQTFALVHTLAPSESSEGHIAKLGELAWKVSTGNPFVVVETVRSRAQGVELADSVRELVTNRLDRLSDRAQLLTGIAAVIGREFEFELLGRASGLADRDLAVALEELVRRGVMHGVGERFDFTHDRIRDVAHAGLFAPRRRVIHRAVADAIQVLYADRLDSHVLALGLHYFGAELWVEAMQYLRRAAAYAFARSAYREASTSLRQVLAAAAHLSQNRENLSEQLDVQLELRSALWPLAAFDEIKSCLAQAEALADSLDDASRQGKVATFISALRWIVGDFRAALDSGRRAQAIASSLDDLSIRMWSNFYIGLAHHLRGEYRQSRDAHLANLESGTNSKGQDGIVMPASQFVQSAAWLVLPLCERGEFEAGVKYGYAAISRAEANANPYELVVASFAAAFLHCMTGELVPAVPLLERALDVCRERDLKVWAPQILGLLGHAYSGLRRLEHGLSLFERAMEMYEETRGWPFRTLLKRHYAAAQLNAGHSDAARDMASKALDEARVHGESGHEAWALHLLAEISLADSIPEDAEMLFTQAKVLSEKLEMRPLFAHCGFGLARSHKERRRRRESNDALSVALEMFQSMGMSYWVEQARRL